MRKKLISILIVSKETALINHMVWMIRKTLPSLVKTLQAISFEDARDIITNDLADIFVIDLSSFGDEGEAVMQHIRNRYPGHPMIIYLESETSHDQWKLYQNYRILDCVMKKTLLDDMKKILPEAYQVVMAYQSLHIAFPSKIFKIADLCYVKSDGDYLDAYVYDFEEKVLCMYDKKMSMKQFMVTYNKENDLVRCHNRYIVNIRMIEKVDAVGNYFVLAIRDEKKEEIQIPISKTYRKAVLERLKGLY